MSGSNFDTLLRALSQQAIAPSGRAILNMGCAFAVVFWGCVFFRSKEQRIVKNPASALDLPLAGVCAIMLSVLMFQQTLENPFQFDAFTHLFEVRNATLQHMFERFARERLFFRPAGFLAYWIDARWAGLNLVRWHLGNIVLHSLNGMLVYFLLVRLEFRRFVSAFGATLFLTSGLSAEPVAWIDAPFDLLATLFVLLTMLAVLSWSRSGSSISLLLCAVLTVIGCTTKESAFCAPLLAGALSVTQCGAERKRAFRGTALIAACTLASFAYRWWVLQGIGGYTGLSGVHFFSVLELLVFRIWGILQFPINWSSPAPAALWVALGACCTALLYVGSRGRARRDVLIAGITWAVAAILPAISVAMISSDLAGSRVYYLASAGITLALVSAIDGASDGALKVAAAVAILNFNLISLEHNLKPWFQVSRQAAEACRTFGSQIGESSETVRVLGLPAKRAGVYFLSNGFPECVALYSGEDPGRITSGGKQTWQWRDGSDDFIRIR